MGEEVKEITETKRSKAKKTGAQFWLGFVCAVVLFIIICAAAVFWALMMENRGGETSSFVTQQTEVRQKLGRLEGYIRNSFLNDIDDSRMEDYLYYGLVAGLGDPYAAYYNEEETRSMLDSSSGSYCGVGAVFSQNITTGQITLVRVYEGFPSYEAGMLPEDILYMVNDEDITGEDLTNVVTKIKGEEGTKVKLSVLRGEEVLDFTLERKVIEVPTVEHQMLEGNTGYIMITEFDGVTDKQFHQALTELSEEGMERLVIDLRNNGGGNVDTVCNIADELLPEGPIVFTEYKDGRRVERSSESSCIELPMAVLMNGNSASASEILAGALQDYEAAVIVGTQSFGKGIVQSVFDLQDGTALKLTTAKYFTPDNHDIHGIGITPDVEIDLPEELKRQTDISYEDDVQLQKAIEVLQK